jgi:outer membrane lipoprotein SlyB
MRCLNIKTVTVVLLSLLLTACVSNLQGDSYARQDARKIQTVQYGTVEDVRMVVIEGTKTPVGSAAGAAIGGIAGSSVGDGKGAAIATVVGAVAGGLAGGAVEEQVTKSQGVELIVRLDNSDKLVAIVQKYQADLSFHPGDRVRLMTVNGQTRVAQ